MGVASEPVGWDPGQVQPQQNVAIYLKGNGGVLYFLLHTVGGLADGQQWYCSLLWHLRRPFCRPTLCRLYSIGLHHY